MNENLLKSIAVVYIAFLMLIFCLVILNFVGYNITSEIFLWWLVFLDCLTIFLLIPRAKIKSKKIEDFERWEEAWRAGYQSRIEDELYAEQAERLKEESHYQ